MNQLLSALSEALLFPDPVLPFLITFISYMPSSINIKPFPLCVALRPSQLPLRSFQLPYIETLPASSKDLQTLREVLGPIGCSINRQRLLEMGKSDLVTAIVFGSLMLAELLLISTISISDISGQLDNTFVPFQTTVRQCLTVSKTFYCRRKHRLTVIYVSSMSHR